MSTTIAKALSKEKKKIGVVIFASFLSATKTIYEAVNETYTFLAIMQYIHASLQFVACFGLGYYWFLDEDETLEAARHESEEEHKDETYRDEEDDSEEGDVESDYEDQEEWQ